MTLVSLADSVLARLLYCVSYVKEVLLILVCIVKGDVEKVMI